MGEPRSGLRDGTFSKFGSAVPTQMTENGFAWWFGKAHSSLKEGFEPRSMLPHCTFNSANEDIHSPSLLGAFRNCPLLDTASYKGRSSAKCPERNDPQLAFHEEVRNLTAAVSMRDAQVRTLALGPFVCPATINSGHRTLGSVRIEVREVPSRRFFCIV